MNVTSPGKALSEYALTVIEPRVPTRTKGRSCSKTSPISQTRDRSAILNSASPGMNRIPATGGSLMITPEAGAVSVSVRRGSPPSRSRVSCCSLMSQLRSRSSAAVASCCTPACASVPAPLRLFVAL